MSNYPYSFDNGITLPGVSDGSPEDIAITALRSAVFAIETELGITPSGVYPDVRTRLDILESRINYSVAPGILNDGYVRSPLFIWNVPEMVMLTISDGYGAPTEDRLNGSLYMRADGSANSELYIRRGGAWYPVQSDLWMAGGDLSGTYLNQTVIRLQTKPLDSSLTTLDAVEDGYHLTWDSADGYWRAETGFLANNDLAPATGSGTRNTGRTAQTVVGLQNSALSPAVGSASDGYALIWENNDKHWEPQALAIIFQGQNISGDGYVTKVNLRSNKLQQSPSLIDGYVGMINFGTSTDGSGGVSNNYAMILGGDRNSVLGIHGLVVGGFSNSATDGYSVVLNGNDNTASLANGTVINGVGNIVNGIQSTVINGASNTVSGTNSIVSGTNSTLAGDFCTILNGNINSISAGTIHAGIISGHNNQIVGGISAEHSIILGGDTNTINDGNNVLLGTPSNSSSLANFTVLLSGVSNSIATLSDYTVILGGISNSIKNSSEFSFIGTGDNNTVSGVGNAHYQTILNADTCSINGLHSQILNGANNSLTGPFSTIINGSGNTITTVNGNSTILDGYNQSITVHGSWIGDGYNNTISEIYSTILNGNFNTINSRNSTILNGANNIMDSASAETIVLVGENNTFINSGNATVAGSNNTFTNAAQTFVIGTLNNVQSASSFINGTTNTLASGTSNVRVFGGFNAVSSGSSIIFLEGNSNQIINSASSSIILGSNNTADTGTNMLIVGSSNTAAANSSVVEGQFGKSRIYGQVVQSVNTGFGTNRIGEAQYSRVVLEGSGLNASQFFVQTHDPAGAPANLSFQDGYAYEMTIRVMVVNRQAGVGSPPFSTVPTRYIFDVLAHEEAGVLVLDDVNKTLQTQNITSWTVTLATSGNQLTISVDTELAPFINGTGDDRRAIATVEWRELSRVT